MRTFLAIEIPDEIRLKLSALRNKFDDKTAKIKWVETDNIHLTLKFLGEIDDQKVKDVINTMRDIEYQSFSSSISGFGVFPNENYMKVLWAGIAPNEEINRLHSTIEFHLSNLGFNNDMKFSPHATIGRIKSVTNKIKLIDIINRLDDTGFNDNFSVRNFKMKKSILKPTGPIYEDLAVFDLK